MRDGFPLQGFLRNSSLERGLSGGNATLAQPLLDDTVHKYVNFTQILGQFGIFGDARLGGIIHLFVISIDEDRSLHH